jgi:6-phosphogluconolactonase
MPSRRIATWKAAKLRANFCWSHNAFSQPTQVAVMSREIKVLSDANALSRAAADEFSRLARQSIAAKNQFAVSLAGGSTPRGAYARLADQDREGKYGPLAWEKIHIFFGDERHVPPDDAESNYKMARETLLSKVPIPPANVHRMQGELEATAAAEAYQKELQRFFDLRPGELPRFDLILLGLGDDGHTASLFPDTAGLVENSRLVIANWVEQLKDYRLSFTFPVLNHAAETMFLVAGDAKAEVVKKVLGDNATPGKYPAQRINPTAGRLLWLLDQPAAQLLKPHP